ncbi:hypothetical protein AWW70_00415 [Bacillus mycoides]|uniref:Uncharacterized protein n=1 Tax=Bacillus mycoides TaxID=1405 RepID=A0A109GFS6_BACMY|nr:hypothetical protein [Bacillus mycoides]KWU66051.1 hypothetical protein AWW70_00415 [Bacillus mycoides]
MGEKELTVEKKVGIVELRIQVIGLQQTMEALLRKVDKLENELEMKADITHVQEMVKHSVVIKKINDSKSIGMDSKVGISLDGKVSLESIVEQTTGAIKISATNINGVKTNETK